MVRVEELTKGWGVICWDRLGYKRVHNGCMLSYKTDTAHLFRTKREARAFLKEVGLAHDPAAGVEWFNYESKD